MAKIVLLVAFLALSVYAADALECYNCDPCTDDSSKWSKVSGCGNVATADHQGVCAKNLIKDKTGSERTVRKCVLAKKTANGPEFDCKVQGTEESKTCNICTTELCNDAPAVNLSLFAMYGVISLYVIKKFL